MERAAPQRSTRAGSGRGSGRANDEIGTNYAALLKENEQLRRRLREHGNEQSGIAAFATAAMRSPITGHVYLRHDLILVRNRRFREMVRSEGGPWRAETGLELATLTEVVCAESRNLQQAAHVARYTRADGERVFEVRTERIGDDLPLVVATVIDISAVVNATRRAEAARSVAKLEALHEASRKKDEFLGMLSHELRNPLAPIRNSVYLLDHADAGGEQARRAREVLRRQVAHLARLVDDLLDVTRIERGKLEIRRGDVDIAELVRRTAEDYRDLVQQRGIALDVEAPREAIRVNGDDTRIAQAIGNLINNAAKFTGDDGRVTLSVSPLGHAAEVRVRDTGIGMDPELVERVFEPFTQARQSLARTAGGLGLGLALVKGIVDLHGGSVRASSAGPGKGSEFILRFPLTEAAVEKQQELTPASSRRTSGARHVLVVEDNPDAAVSLADLVGTFGHEVDVVYDGPSAISRALATRPDVVLCDIGLPGVSGYEVARALRGSGMETKLIALSGYAQPDDVKRALESGFDAHLAKPCDPEKIAALLA